MNAADAARWLYQESVVLAREAGIDDVPDWEDLRPQAREVLAEAFRRFDGAHGAGWVRHNVALSLENADGPGQAVVAGAKPQIRLYAEGVHDGLRMGLAKVVELIDTGEWAP